MGLHEWMTSGPGYYTGQSLNDFELRTLRDMIAAQYLERVSALAPALAERAAALGIQNYHRLGPAIDHETAWPKASRILPAADVAVVRRMSFFRAVEAEFGPVVISDDELNWRLVRPGAAGDVGPVHADEWFWDLGYGRLPDGHYRFKVWIPVFAEPGYNGLCVKPFSHHRTDWRHHTEIRHGIPKPVFDEDAEALDMQLLSLGPGQLVMFHDRLLHGGVVNRGATCRVSVELTVFFRVDSGMPCSMTQA